MESVSIEHRALVLRRGLNDRSASVKSACIDMLKKWMSSNVCENDPIAVEIARRGVAPEHFGNGVEDVD